MKKYLAFDVGGTSVKYAVVNEEGEVSSSNKFKTPDTLEKMYQEIENVAHEYQDIEGIALSMPGAVDSDGGIIYGSSAIDYIHGPNIKEDLKQRLNKDVELVKLLVYQFIWKMMLTVQPLQKYGKVLHVMKMIAVLLLVEQELVEQLLKIVMFIMEMHYMVENLVI